MHICILCLYVLVQKRATTAFIADTYRAISERVCVFGVGEGVGRERRWILVVTITHTARDLRLNEYNMYSGAKFNA